MKKTLIALIGITAIGLTSCGDSNLNEATALTGCEQVFLVGPDGEGVGNYVVVMHIDTVIDDITPPNPDALMLATDKIVRICYRDENPNYADKTELDFMNIRVYDTKTKKEYSPSLRDDESKYSSTNNYFTVDVPKDTKMENLSVGALFSDEKNYENFIPLKSKAEPKKDVVVKMNKEAGYDGIKSKLTSVTYNVDNNDKIVKQLKEYSFGKVVKVDVTYELVEGDKGFLMQVNNILTNNRVISGSAYSANDLGFSIEGKGTSVSNSYYFLLYADEEIMYVTDNPKDPNQVFDLTKE